MGAMAELRPIIIIGSFMAMVVILISLLPFGFFGTNAVTVTPTNTSFYDLLGTNDTLVYNLTGVAHNWGNRDFGGWHLLFAELNYGGNDTTFYMEVADAWYGWFYNAEDFLWFDASGTIPKTTRRYVGYPLLHDHDMLMLTTISADYNSGNISSLSYLMKSSRTTMKAIFYFDQTVYSNPLDAYVSGELVMVIGIDFDERNTQINAWSVIGAILTFQLIPNCEPTIALLVEIPFWLSQLYVVFIMLLRVIGAVFGGGGA